MVFVIIIAMCFEFCAFNFTLFVLLTYLNINFESLFSSSKASIIKARIGYRATVNHFLSFKLIQITKLLI